MHEWRHICQTVSKFEDCLAGLSKGIFQQLDIVRCHCLITHGAPLLSLYDLLEGDKSAWEVTARTLCPFADSHALPCMTMQCCHCQLLVGSWFENWSDASHVHFQGCQEQQHCAQFLGIMIARQQPNIQSLKTSVSFVDHMAAASLPDAIQKGMMF